MSYWFVGLYTREFHCVSMDMVRASELLDESLAAAADAVDRIEHPEWWADWPDGTRDGTVTTGGSVT